MKRIIFRCPDEIISALERKAAGAGLSLGKYVRRLCEQDTGISVPIIVGLGGASPETRKRVQAIGARAHKRAARKKRQSKKEDDDGQ